jgi:hypothetical protein
MSVDIFFVENIGVEPMIPTVSERSSPSSLFSNLSFLLKIPVGIFCGEYRSRTDDLLRARQAL